MATQTPVSKNLKNMGATTVIGAPGAGKQLVIVRGNLRHRDNKTVVVTLREAGSATPVFTASLTATDSVASFDFGGEGWKLSVNKAFEAYLDVTGDVDINVTEWF